MSEKSPAPPQPPLCLALVVADAIHRDPGSNKHTILGTFSTLFARDFPAQHPVLWVYAVLTDGIGKTPVKLKVVAVEGDGDVDIAEADGEVDFEDPRIVMELVLAMPGIVFPAAGEYRLQLWASDDLLMERRVMMIHASPFAPNDQGEGDNE